MYLSGTGAFSVLSLKWKRFVSSYSLLFSKATQWGELNELFLVPISLATIWPLVPRKKLEGKKKKKHSINRHFIFCNISLPTSLSMQLLKGAKVLIWNTYSSKYFFFHGTTLLGCNNPGFSRLQLGNMLLYFACAKNCGFGFFVFLGWVFGGFGVFFFFYCFALGSGGGRCWIRTGQGH